MSSISDRIRGLTKESVGKKAQKAAAVVLNRQDFIRQFADLEDLILRGPEVDTKAAAAAEHNLRMVRAELARILWKNEVFIGVDVIDQVLFGLVVSGSATDIVPEFLRWIQHNGLHRAGFVVYPLHSFGVLGLGFYSFYKKTLPYMMLRSVGISITAQTNNKDKTIDFLESVRSAFGISQRIPVDLVEHFMQSRSLRWIERNPLLALRIRSFSGSYYENQFIYMLKLRMTTAPMMMLSVMEKRRDPDDLLIHGSSARVNNWQTLDIRHYLTFETPPKQRTVLSAYCIPMNAARLELALLSDLNIAIDPHVWSKLHGAKLMASIHQTLTTIESGYLTHVMLGNRDSVPSRVHRKLVTSIDAFRRSFSAGVRESEAIASLAIAFETLVTDHYAPGVADRILRRVRLCLKGASGTRRYQWAVRELFECRGAIVHQGAAPKFSALRMAQQAYVLCLQQIVSHLPRLPKQSSSPVAFRLGD